MDTPLNTTDLTGWSHGTQDTHGYSNTNSSAAVHHNNSSTIESVTPFPPLTYIYVTVTVLDVLVFIIGVVGNGLVLLVITRQAEMRTATNMFLANLSIADLLVLLVCMPPALLEFHSKDAWYLGDVMCKLVPLVENTVSHTSILTIVAISFERYYAICCPLKVMYICTKRRALRILVSLWIIGILSAIPFIFIAYTKQDEREDTREVITVCIQRIDTMWKLVYIVGIVFVFCLIPMVMLIFLYLVMGQHLFREMATAGAPPAARKIFSSKKSAPAAPPVAAPSSALHRRTVARQQIIYMLIMVITLFFVCVLPIRIIGLWMIFSPMEELQKLGLEGYLNLMWFTRIMFYINSVGNPILYNVMSSKFREACKKLIGVQHNVRRESTYLISSRNSSKRSVRMDFETELKIQKTTSSLPLIESVNAEGNV